MASCAEYTGFPVSNVGMSNERMARKAEPEVRLNNKKSRSHRSAADGGRSPRKPDAKRKRGSAQPQESAAINRSCRSHANASKRIARRDSRATTPSAPFRNGTIFLLARPPLLTRRGIAPPTSFSTDRTRRKYRFPGSFERKLRCGDRPEPAGTAR